MSLLARMATVIPVPFLPILFFFVAFAASISIIVGHVVCLFVPADTNAKGFIIGTVVCDLAVVGVRLFKLAKPDPGLFEFFPHGFFLVVLSLQTLGSLLFIVFLRQLAVSLKRRALADEATTLILMGCGVFALSLLTIPFGIGFGFGFALDIVLKFAFFAFGIMMLLLLRRLSNAILGAPEVDWSKMSWWDRQFARTSRGSIVILSVFGNVLMFPIGLIGIASCRNPKAKQHAKLMVKVSFWVTVGFVILMLLPLLEEVVLHNLLR